MIVDAEFAATMKRIFHKGYDPEAAHEEADNAICELLFELGYEEAVSIFKAATKWYA